MEGACISVDRHPQDVKLLLATKTVPAENIRIALQAGETLIGENKLQELTGKWDALQGLPHMSHFIGHLQSNKVKGVLKYVDCIQSIDRLSLAEKLQRRLEFEDRVVDVFLQVNTSFEASKFGHDPAQMENFARQIRHLDRIKVKGLMTIGLFSDDLNQVRKCFRRLKGVQRTLLDMGFSARELSMGMSGDLEIAIEEGATIIRVGTGIFGPRKYPDSYYWNEQGQGLKR